MLQELIDKIDAGNTNITEEDAIEIIKVIKQYTDKEIRMSKYEAYTYLKISRATFDNYVKEGKIPKGEKQAGFKELSWKKKDIENFKI